MPALADTMYCSEQICIPPTFPYLLRQYAKAAIRSQPTDLLRWSTAYFRCLSLNIPPPMKPRLEYPIPRSHFGITPGWLKAILSQLPNTSTVDFKVLWDRWIGACLEHSTLIQILCLGGFDDPMHIPWLRFLGLCAGHLTDNLTSTMILICEIFTEEPEGGSAMIPVDVFVDVYKFLAAIDASHDQILKNYYFLDDLLALWKTKTEKFKKQIEVEAVEEESSTTLVSEESEESVEKEKKAVDEKISCPSIERDAAADYMHFIEEGGEAPTTTTSESVLKDGEMMAPEEKPEDMISFDEEELELMSDEEVKVEEEEELQAKEEEDEEEVGDEEGEGGEEASGAEEETETVLEPMTYKSLETLDDHPEFPDKDLEADLKKLKALQQELAGETDEELEKYKCQLMADMPMTSDQKLAIKHFDVPDTTSEDRTMMTEDKEPSEVPPEEQEIPYEDVWVPAVPGIGPIVPLNLVYAVEEYMRANACLREGMVMPRDIRHYSCPPLECPVDDLQSPKKT